MSRPHSRLRWLGPWAFRPVANSLFAGLIWQITNVGRIDQGSARFVLQALSLAPMALALAAIVFVSFYPLRVLQDTGRLNRLGLPGYLLLTLFAAIPAALWRPLVAGATNEAELWLIGRMGLGLVVVQALLGISEARLRSEIEQKEASLKELRAQRKLLVSADEGARRSVADFLHDRVQANLVVLAVQLRIIADDLEESNAEASARLRSVMDELEELRKFDVRQASRNLSPDVRVTGLAVALDELAHTYGASMHVRLHIDAPDVLRQASSHEHHDVGLAVYRVVEQCLLNAAVHGHARNSDVWISTAEPGEVQVRIVNDGSPVAVGRTPGAGAAIINAWVAIFDGSWSITNLPDGTVEVVANLKTPPLPA